MNRKQRRKAEAEARKTPKIVQRVGDNLVLDRIDVHAFDGKCEFCGAEEELRPYGPNNENICYKCGMKDEETTSRKFKEFMENPQ
jgi:hypothetical protein